jgi:hypothetical protein
VLYLQSYNSDTSDFDGEWDAGFRGGVGWENSSGLFFEVTGFYHDTDWEGEDGAVTGEFEFYYVDFTVGDTIHCGELCLSVAGGLRWGGNDWDQDWNGSRERSEFEGIGPVIALEATRSLSEQFAIYVTLRQSLLFGEDTYNGFDTDTLASITEIGAGLEYRFGMGMLQTGFVRAGFEGQYWLEDDSNIGLIGGVFSLGGRF